MRKILLKWGEWLVHYSNHWWYGPFIALISALDAYVFVLSIEAILFPSVWAHPKKWFSTALWLTVGSAIGATSFAVLTSYYGEGVVQYFFPHILNSKHWVQTTQLIDTHGGWGLAVVSFSPLPQHLAVTIAGLAHMKYWKIFCAIVVGRGAKYIPLAWLTTHAPKYLKKLHILPEEFLDNKYVAQKKAPVIDWGFQQFLLRIYKKLILLSHLR